MVPNAIATTRGSRRRALPNRAVSGATASQPTNDSMITEAALPTAAQPCGANGCQLAIRADGADPATPATTTATSSTTSTICTAGAGPHPGERQAEHGQQQAGRDRGRHRLAAAGQAGHVTPADQADHRCASHHAEQEAPAHRVARPRAEAGRRVRGHAALARDTGCRAR